MADESAPVTSCFRRSHMPNFDPPPDEQRLADVIHQVHLTHGECDAYVIAREILKDGWAHPDVRPSAAQE